MASKVIIAAVCAVILIFAVAFAFDIDTAKCKYSDAYKCNFSECYMFATNQNMSTLETDNSTLAERLILALCMAVMEGYATDNGTNINLPKAMDSFDMIQADDSTKEELKTGLQNCVDKGTDGTDIINCFYNVYYAACM